MDPETQDAGKEPASTSSPPAGTGTEQASSGDDTKKTASELAEARREAAQARADRKKLEARLAELENAQLTEADRLKKEHTALTERTTTLESALRTARLEVLVLREAPKYGLADTAYSAALKLLDPALLEWDDATGAPTRDSVEKAMKALVRDNPFLVAAASASAPALTGGAPTNPARTAAAPLSRAVLEAMSYAERLARKDEIDAWLRTQR